MAGCERKCGQASDHRRDDIQNSQRTYIAIDLKSFYASVECTQRGRDPLTTNLVVADRSRTEKTICLAVSPSLKAYGIPGRARLFEVIQRVDEINAARLSRAPGHVFTGSSDDAVALKADPSLKLDFIAAPPRMVQYMACSASIYNIYLNYIAPEDIHVYSIDEVFMDVTEYLHIYKMTARELCRKMIGDVLALTNITATAGIAPNLFLCKVAMDIVAKHAEPDEEGVRMAELDEMSYRRLLWNHRPLTDFWRIGRGYARKLEGIGLETMGDIARCSLGGKNDYYNKARLYKLFGVNAELLIDHAWGYEPVTMADIKGYHPENSSTGSGQVLHEPYSFEKGKLIAREMIDALVLDLVDKGLVTDQIVLMVGYDIENLADPKRRRAYKGTVLTDFYGRQVPKAAHGSVNLGRFTSSTRQITEAVMTLFDSIVDENLIIRRLSVNANHVILEREASAMTGQSCEQMDLFTDYRGREEEKQKQKRADEREKSMQKAVLAIKKKYGKNAILKGMNFEEGATMRERNAQIGGHRA